MNSDPGYESASPVPVRVGLIGCGKMGIQHLKAIRAVPGAQVVAIADPATTAESLTGIIPANTPVMSDASEMLRTHRPDVVHIVTPPASHAPLAMLALGAGIHVYVEKPFTSTRREAEAILSLARKGGLHVCAGHQYLFERPALITMNAMSEIGRVTHIESFSSFRTVRRRITPVEQAKDILPHAVYPLVSQLRHATRSFDAEIRVVACDVRPDGEINAILRLGDCTGIVIVTLNGRPIEQYQHVIGTNGSLRADYVTGGVVRLTGPGTGVGILFTPYRRAFQTLWGATTGFARLVFRKTSYPGLQTLIEHFYRSIARGSPSPTTPQSIVDTVAICEAIGDELDRAESEAELAARERLLRDAAAIAPVDVGKGTVFVTGGTGFLGRPVVEELRHAGFAVRAVSRRIPRPSAQVAGVEYVEADLGRGLNPDLLRGSSLVIHCAAETAGGKEEHERNSIEATRNVIEAAAQAGVTRFVHISSIAVLKPGHEVGSPLDEHTPVDADTLERGPYVWGKAAAEVLVRTRGEALGLQVKIVRPGPLVDYAHFDPPGRLGRELGPFYVAVGPKGRALSVCDVWTAARVLRSYAEGFDAAPAVLNLIEAKPPERRELVSRFKALRPDLRVIWLPAAILRLMSGPLKLVQRYVLGMPKPVDVYAAFASEEYRPAAAAAAIERAGPSVVSHTRALSPQ